MNKNRILSIVLGVFSLCAFTGCASMMAQFCTESAAYDNGYNQAKNGENRNISQYDVCEEPTKAQARDSYSKGFLDGSKTATASAIGELAGAIVGAKTPKECREEYGQKVCGHNCVAEYGQVKCASRPDHNCVAAFGQIKCGKNCRQEYGQIKCQ
jgi:hypothetical protein